MTDHPIAKAFAVPETDEAAIAMLEQLATLDSELGVIEAERATEVASINAVSDTLALPIIEKKAAIEPWWAVAAPRLTKGKRKSIELGGCKIGTIIGKARLCIDGDPRDALNAIIDQRWAKPYVRVTFALDRTQIYRGLDGKHADALAAAGFTKVPGEESFFVTPIATGAGATVEQ